MNEPPSQPDCWCRVFETQDLDHLAAAQPGWQLQYEQLSAGRLQARVAQVQLPLLRLVQEHTSQALRQRGRFRPGEVGLALGTTHAAGGYFHGQRLDADAIMIGRGDELDLVTPADNLLVGVVVDAALLSEVWLALYRKPWSAWLDCQVVTPARSGMATIVRAQHLRVIDGVLAQPALLADAKAAMRLRDTMLMDWLDAIPERVDVSGLKSAQQRRELVDRACSWVLQQPDDPPTLLAVCRSVGSSPRRLEYCFRDVLGISAHKYLRALRLNAVRRALKEPADGPRRIHDVAARWGFWHMGAFSAAYKQQFGELPSATLAAARQDLRCSAR